METLKSVISKYPVVMLSKTWCPYCKKAKGVLSHYPLSDKDFAVLELDNRDDGEAIQSAAKDLTGQSTVPNIFIKGKSIGGCDDLSILNNSGELKTLIEQAVGKAST